MEFDITQPGALKKIAAQVSSDIDDYCVESMTDGFRDHLGASLIGSRCSRYLWYIFRWAFKEDFSGRILRLFDRGHREEDRFIRYLEGIGCKVYSHDTSKPRKENGEYPQFRISAVNGHFGGSMDGMIEFPERYGIPGRLLVEYKTNGTGSAFTKLSTAGMQIAKPLHFAQMATYGSDPEYNLDFGLYLNTNKNDDSIYVEVVKIDRELGERMVAKAARIITAEEPPARISNKETYYECAYCPANKICHKGAVPERNCRSCENAVPVEDAKWSCRKFDLIIPSEHIRSGCDAWYPITTVS